MQISFHRNFLKMYAKQQQSVQEKFKERRDLFISDSTHPVLRDHALNGKWRGYRSINISGDYRAVYREVADDTFEFVAIGTHHELYGT